MRPSCTECVMKHLGQAAVLFEEARIPEYEHHIVYAWGHMAEAAAECEDVALAMEIRDHRKMHMLEGGLVPIDALIKKAWEWYTTQPGAHHG